MNASPRTGAAERFLREFATHLLPDLGPRPQPGRLTAGEVEERFDRLCAEVLLPGTTQQLLRSAALLWHDHLDESHSISQGIHSREGSLLHGFMHRREPDYGNARYWFNRVGRHPAYAIIGRAVETTLRPAGEGPLAARLAPGGDWDPFAFIDACEEAVDAPEENQLRRRLRQVQAIEFTEWVRHLVP